MTKKQRSNIAVTAIFLLEKVKPEKFNMHYYLDKGRPEVKAEDENPPDVKDSYSECGTTCCFAGHGPVALPGSVRKDDRWETYSDRVFGTSFIRPAWDFLFHPSWPSETHQAAARAVVFLESGIPNKYKLEGDESTRYLENLTKRQLVNRLKKFVIKPSTA